MVMGTTILILAIQHNSNQYRENESEGGWKCKGSQSFERTNESTEGVH